VVAMSLAGTFPKIVFLYIKARNRLLQVAPVADLVAVMVAVMTSPPKRRKRMKHLHLHLRILRLGLGGAGNQTFLLVTTFGTLTMTGRLSLVGRRRNSSSPHLPRWRVSPRGGLL